jgi:hypothetical protein
MATATVNENVDVAATDVEAVDAEPETVITTGKGLAIAGNISFAKIDSDDPAVRAGKVRELLQVAADAGGKLEIVQGELLFEANNNGYWKEYKFTDEGGTDRAFESWDEYVGVELGMKRRTSFKRIEVYQKLCVELDISEETLGKLEWSKVGLISKHLSEDNWSAILGALDGMSFRQVESFNKALKETDDVEEAAASVHTVKAIAGPEEGEDGADGTDTGESTKTFNCKCSATQYESIQAALDAAQGSTGSESAANNLDLICTEYLANIPPDATDGEEAKVLNLSRIIANVEDTYGVTLSVETVEE